VLRATHALLLDNTIKIQSEADGAGNAISPHVHPAKDDMHVIVVLVWLR
jgi:hypothetical protein